MFTTSHGFIYYITQRIVIRISEYKPLGLKENKQKAETISSLLANFVFMNLLDPSPQAARSVARPSLTPSTFVVLSTPSLGSCIYQAIPKDGIGPRHHPYASFMWMQTV